MRNSVRRITIQFAAENKELLNQVKAGFKQVGDEAQKTNDRLEGFGKTFKSLITGFIAGVGINTITNLADSYQKLGDRIRVFEGSQERANSTMANIALVADRTKTSIQDVATVYSRLAQSLKETGITSGSLLFLTEQLQNSFRLSGATAAEATASVVQLSQGLASGQLRGQELRSVLEQNAVFGGLLADQLGKSRGELLKFSEAVGGIKAKDVIAAIVNGAEKLNREAALLGSTFQETTQKGINKFTIAIGEMNKSLGAGAAYEKGMNFLIDNSKLLASLLGAIAVVAIPTLITKLELLGTALLINPLTGPIAVITGVTAAVIYSIVEFERMEGILLKIGFYIVEVFSNGAKSVNDFGKTVSDFLLGEGNALSNYFETYSKNAAQASKDASNNFKEVSKAFEQNEKARQAVANLGVKTFEQQQAALRKELEKTLNFGKDSKGTSLKQQLESLNVSFNDGKIGVVKYNSELLRLTDLLTDKKGPAVKFKQIAEVLEGNVKRSFEAGLITLKEYNSELEKLRVANLEQSFARGYISAAQFHSKVIEISSEFRPESAFYTGVNNYITSIGNLSTNVAGAVENTFSRLEDSMLDFISTGKFAFKDFAYAVIQDINRIILRAMIIKPLADGILGALGPSTDGGGTTGTSGGGGGVANTMSANFAKGGAFNKGTEFFASGGVVSRATAFGMSSGKMGVMGEAGPEAILPLSRGSGGKLGVRAETSPVVINIVNNTDSQITQTETTGPNGEKQIQLLIQSTVREGLASGTFDKAMKTSFNLNRRGA